MNIGDIRNNLALNYENIILKHKKCIVNSRSECDISTVIAGKRVNSPLFCSNMPAVINMDICKIFDDAKWFHVYHRINGYDDTINYIKRANNENWRFVSPSIGIKEGDFELVKKIYSEKYRIDCLTIDIAHSWQDRTEHLIKLIRDLFPEICLIVGYGDNPEWIRWLEQLGVDYARIGIGTSKICFTRVYSGVGSTNITDLEKCAGVADKIKLINDGGMTQLPSGEVELGCIAKAIRFGADLLASGAVFSRCIDSPSIKFGGYYGNSSRVVKPDGNHIEGTLVNVKTTGLTIKETIKLVEDSIKSSCSYLGADKLDGIRNCDYQVVF